MIENWDNGNGTYTEGDVASWDPVPFSKVTVERRDFCLSLVHEAALCVRFSFLLSSVWLLLIPWIQKMHGPMISIPEKKKRRGKKKQNSQKQK